VRDILFVTDAVSAFDAFYKNRKPGVYNIGGSVKNITSLGESLKMISEITGIKQNISYEPQRLGDLLYFVCDITKAKRELGWEPKVSNREGIEKLVKWVEENISVFRGRS
jgi:CDP-paratose 2-epimerase